MAKTSKARSARDTAEGLASNPYVRKLIEDGELRDNIRGAYDSARSAYGRLNNGKAPTSALLDDKKVQKDLRKAAEQLRAASDTLREEKRKRRWTRLLAVAVVGAVIAMVVSEGARKALLDRLFGAEEEFEYTSTTTVNGSGSAASATEAAASSS
jgi:hypothetical protein